MFTLGSQIDPAGYRVTANPGKLLMFVLKKPRNEHRGARDRADGLGTWRQRNLLPYASPRSISSNVAYVFGAVSGLLFAIVVVGCPSLLSSVLPVITLERNPRNYDVSAIVASFVAFIAGHNQSMVSRWLDGWSNTISPTESK